MTLVLQMHEVSKRYRVRPERSLVLGMSRRSRSQDFWALRDVSVDVHEGEVVAVIGRNGAGKSTLLKLAAGVTRSTSGSIHRPRRVAPLIEVGAGFHPELTGRENVKVNARLLGLSGPEIRAIFDDVVDFAGLSGAIDQPIRQYSSGMFMRLGFSVAVHTRPQLLIVDEVLAVGDSQFQLRCLDKIEELRREGAGVLFVSHNLEAVQRVSDRALLLDQGRTEGLAPTDSAVNAYHQLLAAVPGGVAPSGGRRGARLELVEATLTNGQGSGEALWEGGSRADVTLRLRALADTPESFLGVGVNKDDAGPVVRWLAEDGPFLPPLRSGQEVELRVNLGLHLAGGGYSIDCAVSPRDKSGPLLHAVGILRFGVSHRPGVEGIVDAGGRLSVVTST